MLTLYAAATPNGLKPILALEMLGIEYRIEWVDLGSGQQKKPEFLRLNPNGRIPVLVDPDTPGGPLALSESAAILIYLAERSGKLLPASGTERARVFEQLFFHASGLGPALGNAGWFMRSAAEPMPLAIERFRNEALRVMGLIDGSLEQQKYVAGNQLTIADIAHFGWLSRDYIGLGTARFPNIERWLDDLRAMPAVQRALAKVART